MKKEHKKFLKIIKRVIKRRPDLPLYEIIVFLLANQTNMNNEFILLKMKQRAKKLIENGNKKKDNTSTEGPSTGGNGGSPSEKEG